MNLTTNKMTETPRPQLANGLHWVRGELELSLARARSALEQHAESPEDAAFLQTASDELQVIRGTLSMIQCFGAATFAAEMVDLLKAVRDGRVPEHDAAYSALSAATLQLSDYLDLLSRGEQDQVLVLQPALNELRAARGEALLTEADLFSMQARAERLAPATSAQSTVPAGAAQALAKRDLPQFQASFLQWFRNAAAQDALSRMAQIAAAIGDACEHAELRTLWSAYAALAESLRNRNPGDSLELKRLFGRAGTQLKLLADSGEDLTVSRIGDTVYVLLYHLSRLPQPSARANELTGRFDLAHYLPTPTRVDELRRRLRGPGSSILDRVYAEIRNDFSAIKDAIDLVVRTNGRAATDLANAPARLRNLAKTLSALGLPLPQQVLTNQAAVLEAGTPLDPIGWMEVATAILRVEHSLEEALFRAHGRNSGEAPRAYDAIETEIPHAQDLRASAKALLRETLINVAQMKAGVDVFLKDGDEASLADAPELLHEVGAALIILDQLRAAGLVTQLERYVSTGALVRAQASAFGQERFADAIACVELYLEALRDGLPNPARIVEDLGFYVSRLEFVEAPAAAAPEAPALSAEEEIAALEAALLAPIETPEFEAPAAEATFEEAPIAAPPAPAPVSVPIAEGIDPEMRDIFIEEAGEVLDDLRRLMPPFRRDPSQRETLSTVRRAFHTLKGSGRMVGALRIGEFAWAIEQVLNRCLEGALRTGPTTYELVANAVEALPQLIDNFRGEGQEGLEASEVIRQAEAMLNAPTEVAEPDVRSVFCEDARERLASVQRWLEAQDLRDGQFDVDGDAIRAFHTLKGSAAVVNAVAISRVSAAIENYLNGLRTQGQLLPPQALALLADAVQTLRAWVDALAADRLVDDDVASEWQRRIDELDGKSSTETIAPATAPVNPAFAIATLDTLQFLEARARAWSGRPGQSEAGALTESFGKLADSAELVQSLPLATLMRELAGRLEAWRLPDVAAPTPAFFTQLLDIIEGLYQQLDLYREGALTLPGETGDNELSAPSTALWLARVRALLQPELAAAIPDSASPTAMPFDDAAVPALPPLDLDLDLSGLPSLPEPEPLPPFAELPELPTLGEPLELPEIGDVLTTAEFETPAVDEQTAPSTMEVSSDQAGVAPVEIQPVESPSVLSQEVALPDIDEELLEIFSGEAEELLESLDQQFGIWAREPLFSDALTQMRRDLHTLKGSARTAGASHIGDVAHFLETLLDRPEQSTPELLRAQLQVGLDGLHDQLDALVRGRLVPSAVLMARITHAGAAINVVPPVVESGAAAEPLFDTAPDAVAETPVSVELESPAEVEAESFIAAIEAETIQAPEVAMLDSTQSASESAPADTGGDEVIELGGVFEHEASDFAPLIEDVASAPELIEPPAMDAPIFDEIPSAFDVVIPDSLPDTAVEASVSIPAYEAPIEAASVARTDTSVAEPIVEALATEEMPSSPEFVVELEAPPAEAMPFGVDAVEASMGLVDASATTNGEPELESFSAPVMPEILAPVMPAASAAAPALDQELVDIFSAEATELLEVLDTAFDGWEGGDAGESLRTLQRALHTLKGGARMAGIDAMGDAVHTLETDVTAASDDFPAQATFRSLRQQLDTLQRMHDQIRRGEAHLLVAPQEAAEATLPVVAAPAPVASTSSVAPIIQWSPALFWRPDEDLAGFGSARSEVARVPVDALDAMLNQAGEISIYRSRLEELNTNLKTQLHEMAQTVSRVREQLRQVEIETEAQIAARGLGVTGLDRYAQDFDPLEMDRYSRMQELSRALAESNNDLLSLQATMDESASSAEVLLQQQSRVNTEVQQGLMGTLMVPFARQVQRLLRVVRQTAQENGKLADLQFIGAESELDRNVLERMTAPLEHLLRNAVVHGIEDPATRTGAGKAGTGIIQIRLRREGSQLLVEVADDGGGLNFAAIRNKAVERGMMNAEAQLSNDALARFIFEPGFSTARALTQDAGRGIGMDVVASEVKQLGGTLELRSDPGQGTRFLIRLPLTLAVSQALLVDVGDESFAIPLPSIEGVARVLRADLANYYRADGLSFSYGGHDYQVSYLGDYLNLPRPTDGESRTATMILIRITEGLSENAERRVALVVDHMIGNREVVSKAVGPQVSSVVGIAGATILADGRVVLILDVPALIIEATRKALLAEVAHKIETKAVEIRDTIMVVDDSITMRRVAERLLTRQGYRVVTAKDGLDAIALLQTESPVTVLLDIEMPRADGFEVAAFIRNNARLKQVPIIMITSRSGEKHRERAHSLGVDRYLIKPYQEEQLLAEVNSVRSGA